GKKSASILTSMGCPFNCAFCNSIMFKKVRFRSPEHVAKEINTLYYHHNISNFRMQDDLFTMKVNRIARIFEFTPKINYRCFSRADTLTKPVCDLLRKTGCMHVSIGVESGSQEILKNMNKGINQRDIKKGIKNAKAAGLQVRIYIIVGFPGETNKTIEESIRFIRRLDFDEFAVYPLIPYPGTDLFNNAEKYGITNIDYAYDKYIQIGKNRKAGFTVRTKDFDEGQVRIWRQRMIDDLECNLNKSWSLHKSKCR
ncbi:MAG: B12-binding domain-containing radical SAM protein, partial [bacterium]